MKKSMKVLGILLCAVLLVVGSVAATLAYLTAKSVTVTNTFTVGNVALKLDEAQVNSDGQPLKDGQTTYLGQPVTIANADRTTTNTYHLISGNTYTKDPTVTVTINAGDSAYVRMMVEMQGTKWSDIVSYLTGYNASDWILQNAGAVADDNGVYTYEFRYKEAVSETKGLPALFTAIDLKNLSTEDTEYQAITNLKNISVEAHAIQSEGFANEAAAWEAFDLEYAQAQA